jgi:predicted RNase H-like HicB family nuclease
MLLKKYPIAVERGDGGTSFGVVFPDVPGCFSAGETFEEAIDNAKEALLGFFEVCQLDDEPLPTSGNINVHIDNPDFKHLIWSFLEVDIAPYLGKSKKVNVTLPEFLIKQIDEIAATNPAYKTRSGFLAAAANHELASIR